MAGQSIKQQERQERRRQSYGLADAEGAGEVKTRLAFLATVGHLHTEPLKYDLACLRSLLYRLEPDLLGVEIEPSDWEQGTLSSAPVEVREALIPASAVIDTVVVPLGGSLPELAPSDAPSQGLGGPNAPNAPNAPRLTQWWEVRARLLTGADRLFTSWQRDRAAQGPEAVNSRLFGHVCGLVCAVEAAASGPGRQAWEGANERILERLLEMVRRDPGRRVLVAVNCRSVHWLESRLLALSNEINIVPYGAL